MRLPVAFHRATRTEFIEAASRYELQRPGLCIAFIEEIERCLALAAVRPDAYAAIHKTTRRITTRIFPFRVYFRNETARIVIVTAVFHGRRNPTISQRCA